MVLLWLSRLLVTGMIAALFIGGAQPEAAGLLPAPWDKLAHAGCFFVLTVLLGIGFAWPLWLIALVAAGIGATDEWHQLSLPGRESSLLDWTADLLGVGMALWAVWWLRLRLRLRLASLGLSKTTIPSPHPRQSQPQGRPL